MSREEAFVCIVQMRRVIEMLDPHWRITLSISCSMVSAMSVVGS